MAEAAVQNQRLGPSPIHLLPGVGSRELYPPHVGPRPQPPCSV